MVLPQYLLVASFLAVTLFAYWTHGRISHFWWTQPLVPPPAGLPQPAVGLQPHGKRGGDGRCGQKVGPVGRRCPGPSRTAAARQHFQWKTYALSDVRGCFAVSQSVLKLQPFEDFDRFTASVYRFHFPPPF